MEFRDAVKSFRADLGITQAELATALHINEITVRRWELGKNLPNRAAVSMLMDYARKSGASDKCMERLRQSARGAAKDRLEKKNGSLYSIEHASLGQLIDDASFPIYVCDMETDELLYMNQKAVAMVGTGQSAVGRKCYEGLMHRDSPCKLCRKSELTQGSFISHNDYCPFTGATYLIQGKLIQWNGRRAQVRYVIDQGLTLGQAATAGAVRDYYPAAGEAYGDAAGENTTQDAATAPTTERLVARHDRIIDMLDKTPSGLAIIEVDPRDVAGSLHTLYYNDRFISFSGYGREEYDEQLKQNEMHFVFKEDIPTLLADTAKMCASEEGVAVDSMVRCHTKDGGYRWLLLTGQLTERRGDTCVISIAMVDITERQKSIDRQRINEEMLRIAAETDKRAMIVYDVKNNSCRVESRTLFSAEFGRVFEDVPQSLIELGITHRDSVDELCSLFARIRSGEPKIRASLKMRSGTDKYEWFECNAAAVFDAEGQPDHAVLVFHNITEQRVKEAVFKKWQQSINTRPPESYTLLRCNLSKDASLDGQDGSLLKIKFAEGVQSFNSRVQLYADEYVYAGDREAYIALLDSDTLLAMFYRGEHSAALEYRETGENGETLWRRLTVEMVEYLDSSDIQAFIMYEDIDEEKKSEIEAREIAETDPLTGALNRVTFADKVDTLISGDPAVRNALIMIDMDGFKELNDTFGHAAGDQALQEVVTALRSLIRSSDLVGRLGGDEFFVWLHDIPYDAVIAKTARQICDRIHKAYSQEVRLSASVGIAVYPRDGRCFDELYPNADKALYRVKQGDKGSYAFFSPIGEERTPELVQALSEVRQAPQSPLGVKRRLLIVDDSESSRAMLKSIFKDEYITETAKNGSEAMIRLRHFGISISAVLLDLMMPGMDGFAVLKKIQSNKDLRTIPVIVVTGDGERYTLLKAMELGAAEFVTKPVDVDIIRMRVQSVISKAENERLRAQNSYLMLQRDAETKYRTVLESTGTVVVEYDWRNHVFTYDSGISKYILGHFDHRGLWQVLLSDMVADSADVKSMQDMMIDLANNRDRKQSSRLIKLKTPDKTRHWFRMNIYKSEDEYGLAEKMIITFNDVHEEVLANDRLLFQATRDALTGLYNRAGFIEKAAELIAAKEPGYYVMACVDVEKFKVINDQYGTAKGDEILRGFARVLEGLFCGDNGLCCRVMADNFAALYPARLLGSAELEDVQLAAKRLDKTLPAVQFAVGRCLVEDKTLDVSAVYDRAAIAKNTVKGRYDTHIAIYDESMRTAILRQQEITGQMNRALESGQFEVWLQPQFNHTTGSLSGAEALVRWRHPVEGIIPPAEFVAIFERNGFVYEMDKYVWEQTCILLRKWLDHDLKPVPVSVNISRYDVFRADMICVIEGLVKKYDLPLDLLRLEITESAFTESTDQIIKVVQGLVDAGFTVEIDDFGSGYSSLNTLKDVPAQILKMDMRFLKTDRNAQRGGSIIESVVRMAKWLGMSVIAEGVENLEQADYLRSIGCEYIQGYLYSRPVQAAEYEKLVANGKMEFEQGKLRSVETWNNNAFWNPTSMETLIFNSYVGSACILEYTGGKIEMLRATGQYIKMLGNAELSIADVLGIDWATYMNAASLRRFVDAVTESKETNETVFGEYEFIGLPGCPVRTVIRGGVRVIATSGDRWLVYCISENITAQREAEENEKKAVRKHEQTAGQIKAILDNVDVGVVASIFKDGRTQFLFANEKYYKLLGYTKEQFEAEITDPYTTFAPEDLQRTKDVFLDHMRREAPGAIEALMLRRDGSRRLVRDAFSTCHFAGIEGPVQLSIFRDITDEHEVRLRERQSAEEISLIMENVNCGICAIDMSGRGIPHFIFANDQFYSAAGYTKEQIRTEVRDFTDLVHPDDQEKVKEVLAGIMSSHTPVTFDFRCIRRDGSVIFLNSSVSFADMTGYGKVAILVQTDISEAIRSKQSIQQLASQLEVIINNTADAITAIAVGNGRPYLVFANDRHYEQLGATKDKYAADYEGKTDFVLEEDRERVAALLFKADSVGRQTSVEFRIRRTDGAIRWMRSNITVVDYPGVDGPVQLAVTSDITAQVEAVMKEQRMLAEMQTMLADMPGGFVRIRVGPGERYEATFCNEGFCKLLGMDFDTLISRYSADPIADVHPDDVAAVRESIAEIQDKDEARSSRYRLLCANGDYVWVTVFGRCTRDQNGNSFLNLYYNDETTREKEARRREMLMDNLPWGTGAYAFKDGQMSLIYQNKSYWELVGLSDDKFPDPAPMSAIHPDDVPLIMQKLASAIAHHEDVICDIRLRHLTLGYRLVHLVARVVPDRADGFMIVATFIPNEQVEISYQHILPRLLSTIMEASNDYVFAKDKDLRYICCSPAFVELAGLESEFDAVGKSDFELFPPDMAEQFRKNDLALLESGKPMVDFDETVYSKDGTPHYCLASKYILRDAAGAGIGIYGLSRDVTKERGVLEQLQMVNDDIPGGIATYLYKDDALQIVYCNDGFCRLFGGTREGFEKRGSFDPLDWVFEEDRAERMRQIHALVENNTPIDDVYRIHTIGGGYRWINQKSSTVDRRGDSVRFNAVSLDITDRQIVNEQLRISEEEYDLAIQHGGSMICRFDIAAKTLKLSPDVAARHSMPATMTDVPYRPVRLGVVAPESVDAYVSFFEAIISGSKSESAVFQLHNLDGWRWMEAKSTTIFSDDGKPARAIISLFDVTDRLAQETIYKKWQHSMDARDIESYTLFRCNLNRDVSYEARAGTLFSFDIAGVGGSFNDRALAYANQCVYREDRKRYLDFADSNAMLARFYGGKRTDTLEYRELMPGRKNYRWLRLTIDLAEYPNSTDVEAYLMYENIDEVKQLELEARSRSEDDALTGILNRATFISRMEQAMKDSAPGTMHALLMLDVDNFKQVNDTEGHMAGDQVLIDLTGKIRSILRRDDLFGRMGGDEFFVFLKGIPGREAAAAKAKQICGLNVSVGEAESPVTASIGIAIAPEDGGDFDTLYKKVDAALYCQKKRGKNGFIFVAE